MTEGPEWIGAAEAKSLLEKYGFEDAGRAIAERAAAGLIQSRASSYSDRDATCDAGRVPTGFWKSFVVGTKELENWSTGDFKVWRGKIGTLKALGVRFWLQDLREAFGLPDGAKPQGSPETPSAPKPVGGRPPAQWWDDLWIEICRQLYDGDLKPDRQADIEKAMLEWIESRGVSAAPSTVRERARKLFKLIEQNG